MAVKTKIQRNIYYRNILGYIVMVFALAIVGTYVNDVLSGTSFFGDRLKLEGDYSRWSSDAMDNTHIWGTRHYIFFWFGVSLEIFALIRFVYYVVFTPVEN